MNKFLLRHGYIIAFLSCFVAGVLVGSFYESRRTLDVIDHCKEKVEKSNKAIIAYHKGYTASKQNLNRALKLLKEIKELLIRKEKELQDLKLENHKLKNFT